MLRGRRIVTSVVALTCLAACLALPASGLAAKCDPVVNPYAGSRYDGIDLRRIRATNVTCDKARKVVRRGHRKALLTYELKFKWHDWKIKGHLGGSVDKYRAKRGNARISWVF